MGNIGQLVGPGIFDLARQDLTAGAEWLRANGWDHLISMGYSSGASLSTRWAATQHVPWLRGLALLGAPWGLPEAMEARAASWGAQPSYDEIYARAERVVHDPAGADADRLFVIEHSRGPSARPQDSEVYTYRTWWHSRGPRANGRQDAPADRPGPGADPADPGHDRHHRLARGGRAGSRRSRDAGGNHQVQVSVIEGADHFFAEREFVTIQALVRWLREHA